MPSKDEVQAARAAVGEHIDVTSPYGKRLPPIQDERDPNLRPARTYTDVSIEEAAATRNRVTRANVEPGPSEFSHGRGMVAPLDMVDPSPWQVMANERRTNPADPSAVPVWTEDQEWSIDGTHIALVRETQDPAVD